MARKPLNDYISLLFCIFVFMILPISYAYYISNERDEVLYKSACYDVYDQTGFHTVFVDNKCLAIKNGEAIPLNEHEENIFISAIDGAIRD